MLSTDLKATPVFKTVHRFVEVRNAISSWPRSSADAVHRKDVVNGSSVTVSGHFCNKESPALFDQIVTTPFVPSGTQPESARDEMEQIAVTNAIRRHTTS